MAGTRELQAQKHQISATAEFGKSLVDVNAE